MEKCDILIVGEERSLTGRKEKGEKKVARLTQKIEKGKKTNGGCLSEEKKLLEIRAIFGLGRGVSTSMLQTRWRTMHRKKGF